MYTDREDKEFANYLENLSTQSVAKLQQEAYQKAYAAGFKDAIEKAAIIADEYAKAAFTPEQLISKRRNSEAIAQAIRSLLPDTK